MNAASMENQAEKTSDDYISFSPSGFVAFQQVQFAEFKYKGSDFGKQRSYNVFTNLGLDVTANEHFEFHIGVEGYVWQNTIPITLIHDFSSMMEPQWSFYIHRAEGLFSFGDPEHFKFEIGVGMFPYKYNPDARNLGEYLFRSGTYPGWLITNFDWAAARLTGLRLGSTAWDFWHNDLMLTTEMEMFPYGDLSLSYLTDVSIAEILDIGAGISLARFISANDSFTTPKYVRNIAEINNPHYNQATNDTSYDTTFFTYKGVKIMARLSFDPKGFWPLFGGDVPGFFGENDLKIYGEAAILGVKNQGVDDSSRGLTAWYDDVFKRMPVMFGINIPVSRIFEVCALEFEFYNSPYPNDYGPQLRWSSPEEGCPIPSKGIGDYLVTQTDVYNRDSWKWSVYTKKIIGDHFALITQFAHDHNRTKSSYSLYSDGEESFVKKKHWHWSFKVEAFF